MNEKKFTIHNNGIKESGEFLTVDMVCEMLNDFYEENEQLKQQLKNIKEHIDNSIKRNKEAIEWGKNTGAGVGAMGFYTHMLEEMKKEWFR